MPIKKKNVSGAQDILNDFVIFAMKKKQSKKDMVEKLKEISNKYDNL